jgi:predicted metal-dependent phosphoesterase TrpH
VIDLHTHTYESDGTYSPAELIQAARTLPLDALAITDHDTFAGYDQALPLAKEHKFDLVCGLEMTTRLERKRIFSAHMLVYFLHQPPTDTFRVWLDEILESRRDRNRRLIQNLQDAGVDIELEEVEKVGRTLTGRPHFARVLVNKGYATTSEDAFRRYLGENAPHYAERYGPHTAEAIERVRAAGGLPVLAHPIRLGVLDHAAEEDLIRDLRDAGLGGLEVYHSDHEAEDVARYARLAAKFGLAVTGGSDFHGAAKPGIALGSGYDGNVNVPRSVLDELRAVK